MSNTVEYYNGHAAEYFESTVDADMSYCRDRFMSYLPDGARVLDAGCGSGRDSRVFLDSGYETESFDASAGMCGAASSYLGKEVRCLRFQDMDYDNEFDGVWACASLLHVPVCEMDSVFDKLRTALKEGRYSTAASSTAIPSVKRTDATFRTTRRRR